MCDLHNEKLAIIVRYIMEIVMAWPHEIRNHGQIQSIANKQFLYAWNRMLHCAHAFPSLINNPVLLFPPCLFIPPSDSMPISAERIASIECWVESGFGYGAYWIQTCSSDVQYCLSLSSWQEFLGNFNFIYLTINSKINNQNFQENFK